MSRNYLLLTLLVFYSPVKVTASADTIVSCRDTTVCLTQSDFQINVCTPYGGHYFGPGVKDTVENTYVPVWAGPGTHIVTYKIGTLSCQVRIKIIDLVPAGVITGKSKICSGAEDEIYQIPTDSTAKRYYWKIAQWQNFKDSTSVPTRTIHFDNSFLGGTLQASILNQCGEGPGSNMQIQVLPTPVPSIKNISDTLSQADNICRNQHLTYYANGDFDSCRWVIQGGTLLDNDTSRLVGVKWGNSGGIGLLTVMGYKNGCPGSSSREVNIGEGTAPDPATIWLFGYNMLVCSDSTATSYCWFQDNAVYTGFVSASGRYILPDPLNKQSNYFVRTGSTSSCTSCYNDSKPFNYSKLGLEKLGNAIHVSPNPARGILELRLGSDTRLSGPALLYDQYGMVVKKIYVTSSNFQLDISDIPPGIYFVECQDVGGRKIASKIVKL